MALKVQYSYEETTEFHSAARDIAIERQDGVTDGAKIQLASAKGKVINLCDPKAEP